MEAIDFRATNERLADGTCVVAIAGELDLHTAPALDRALRLAETNGVGRVVVDLSACSFIDSTTLGLLIEANRRLGYVQAPLSIVATGTEIRRAFEVTGLDRVFALHPNRTAALAAGVP